ncbi:MAG: universal stress protein [Deltaproteobacteria bacterium]|nr:universal stress protein [Deltaproteobacteria bacterium]
MNEIKKILAPADLSNFSKTGVRYAAGITESQGAEVIVYNVITLEETPFPHAVEEWVATHMELPQLKKAIEERKKLVEKFINENLADLATKIKIRAEVGIGVPYKKIVEKAIEERADIIVMCTHGRGGLLHMLIGSVTEQVVRRAPCPVVSVPPPREKSAAGEPA